MTKTRASTVSADRLKSIIERVERLLEERAGIQADIKDIFSEAKGVGYDVRTIRTILKLRAKDSADRAEEEALLDTYMLALGMTNHGPRDYAPAEDELLEQAARVVTEVDRCEALAVDGKPPTIAAIQAELGCSLGKASKVRKLVEERISRSIDQNREMKSVGGVEGHTGMATPRIGEAAARDSTASTEAAGIKPGPTDTPNATTSDTVAGDGTGTAVPSCSAPAVADMGNPMSPPAEDTLEIPAHLRRARA